MVRFAGLFEYRCMHDFTSTVVEDKEHVHCSKPISIYYTPDTNQQSEPRCQMQRAQQFL